MKKLITLCLVLPFISCAPKIVPLKGSYPATPIIQFSDNKIDKVWDNVIDFFAQRGLAIKIIDKSSGLIVSDRSLLTWTYENKKGQPIKPDAWVAVPKTFPSGSDIPTKLNDVYGEWNVRLKAAGDRTSINVNLVNIESKSYVGGNFGQGGYTTIRLNGKSTGVFEKLIFEVIK